LRALTHPRRFTVASPAFILASIQNQLRLGMISIPEARAQRYRVLTGLQPDTRHQPVATAEPKRLPVSDYCAPASAPERKLTAVERQVWNLTDQVVRQAKKLETDYASQLRMMYIEPIVDEERPLYTAYGADLAHYGNGLVPGDLDDKLAEDSDRDAYLYCIRDRVEYAIEKRKQAEGDLTHVIGANYSAGAEGSKEWLDEQLAQMRIDYNQIKLQARRFWWNKRRALPKSFRSIHDDPQLQWLTRRAELMRIRFNVRRHLEALGRFDVKRYRVTLANAPAWDRKLRNAAADRRAKQTLYGSEWLPREYVHPTGLITTNPRRRAA
jgi:hypothetical protein